ncbi:hypothetical protein [Delftia acidovorans]
MKLGRKQKRQQFFESHPYCCFCGGLEIATTEDHFPGRSIFIERKWPEGYVFPACEKCNASSSDDELVMAVLARTGPEKDKNRNFLKEFNKAINALQRQNPDLTQGFQTFTRNDERKILKNLGAHPFDENGNPRRPVTIPEEAFEHANNFGRKLAKALHYKHTGKIIPTTGHVFAKVFTNAEWNKVNPEKISSILGGYAAIERNTQPLHNQFSYKYGITADGLASGYFITFGLGTISFIATAFFSEEDYQMRKNNRIQAR